MLKKLQEYRVILEIDNCPHEDCILRNVQTRRGGRRRQFLESVKESQWWIVMKGETHDLDETWTLTPLAFSRTSTIKTFVTKHILNQFFFFKTLYALECSFIVWNWNSAAERMLLLLLHVFVIDAVNRIIWDCYSLHSD